LFEELLPEQSINILKRIAPSVRQFYLAGGTGLALQIGHRRSEDPDFFSSEYFDPQYLLKNLSPGNVFFIRNDTLHCEIDSAKTFFKNNISEFEKHLL